MTSHNNKVLESQAAVTLTWHAYKYEVHNQHTRELISALMTSHNNKNPESQATVTHLAQGT